MNDVQLGILVYALSGFVFVGYFEAREPSEGSGLARVWSWVLVILAHPIIACVLLGRWLGKARGDA